MRTACVLRSQGQERVLALAVRLCATVNQTPSRTVIEGPARPKLLTCEAAAAVYSIDTSYTSKHMCVHEKECYERPIADV